MTSGEQVALQALTQEVRNGFKRLEDKVDGHSARIRALEVDDAEDDAKDAATDIATDRRHRDFQWRVGLSLGIATSIAIQIITFVSK